MTIEITEILQYDSSHHHSEESKWMETGGFCRSYRIADREDLLPDPIQYKVEVNNE